MTDAELLHALAGHHASGSTYALALALRVLGGRATVPKLVALTGFERASIYRARATLDELMPGWRAGPDDDEETVADAELVEDDADDTDGELPVIDAPTVEALALEVLPPTNGAEPPATAPTLPAELPVWREALTAQAARTVAAGQRSWDLYRDLYAPAADVCLTEGDPRGGDLIALAVDYYENVTEDHVEPELRRQIAKLVKSYGKAALYGIREALMRDVELGDDAAMLRYATAVCTQTLNQLRGATDAS